MSQLNEADRRAKHDVDLNKGTKIEAPPIRAKAPQQKITIKKTKPKSSGSSTYNRAGQGFGWTSPGERVSERPLRFNPKKWGGGFRNVIPLPIQGGGSGYPNMADIVSKGGGGVYHRIRNWLQV
jgi:hypothetical protein